MPETFDPTIVAEQMETEIETSLTATLDIASTAPMPFYKGDYVPEGIRGIINHQEPLNFWVSCSMSVFAATATIATVAYEKYLLTLIGVLALIIFVGAMEMRIFENRTRLWNRNSHLHPVGAARRQLGVAMSRHPKSSPVHTALDSTVTKIDKVATIRHSVEDIVTNPTGHANMLRLAGQTETQIVAEIEAAKQTAETIDSKMVELNDLAKAIGSVSSLTVGSMNAHQMLNVAEHLLEDIDTALTLFNQK